MRKQPSLLDVSALKENPNNPRTITAAKFRALVKSVKDFPAMLELRPLVVTADLVVLGGNMRLRACREAGIEKVPVLYADHLTEEQRREFLIKDNVGFGEWDYELLQANWPEATAWGVDIPDHLLVQGEAADDGFVMPDDPQTDIVEGDMFKIGPHALLCGSALDLRNWEKLLAGSLADLVVTDPPYNVGYVGKTKKALTIANDVQTDDDFYRFLLDFYTVLGSYTRPGGGWYVWHADSEGANFRRAFTNAGLLLKQCLVWVKNVMVMGRQDYQWKHEPCLEGEKPDPAAPVEVLTHEPCLYGWKAGAAHSWYADRKQTTVLNFNKPSRNAEHPTMKPVELIGYQIKNSSKNGDIVADGFGGSGTTMVAAHQLGRRCVMTELDPKYCQVIVDRMRKLDPSLPVTKNGKAC